MELSRIVCDPKLKTLLVEAAQQMKMSSATAEHIGISWNIFQDA
jgi:hypothetical protein